MALDAISPIATAVSDSSQVIRAEKLDDLLNGTAFPFFGFHAGIIGTLFFASATRDEDLYCEGYIAEPFTCFVVSGGSWWFPSIFLIGALIAGLLVWLRVAQGRVRIPTMAPTAIFCALLTAIFSVAVPPVSMTCGVLLYALLTIGAYVDSLGTIELSYASLYFACLLSIFFKNDSFLVITAYTGCFVLGAMTLWFLDKVEHGAGLIGGMTIVLVVPNQSAAGDLLNLLAGFAVLPIVLTAAIAYDHLTTSEKQSHLRLLVCFGLVASAFFGWVTFGIRLTNPYSPLETTIKYAAVLFGSYSLFMAARAGTQTRKIRVACVALSAFAFIWSDIGQDFFLNSRTWPDVNRLWWSVLASLLVCAALVRFADHVGDYFVKVIGLVLIALLVKILGYQTLALGFGKHDDISVYSTWALLFVTYGFALWLSEGKSSDRPIAWWRGLVKPRDAVVARRMLVSGYNQIRSIAFLGDLSSLFRFIKYLAATRERLLSNMWAIFFTLVTADLGVELLQNTLGDYFYERISFLGPIVTIAVWTVWGAMFYLYGILKRSMVPFFVGTILLAVPLVQCWLRAEQPLENSLKGIVLMAFGLSLFLLGIARIILVAKR